MKIFIILSIMILSLDAGKPFRLYTREGILPTYDDLATDSRYQTLFKISVEDFLELTSTEQFAQRIKESLTSIIGMDDNRYQHEAFDMLLPITKIWQDNLYLKEYYTNIENLPRNSEIIILAYLDIDSDYLFLCGISESGEKITFQFELYQHNETKTSDDHVNLSTKSEEKDTIIPLSEVSGGVKSEPYDVIKDENIKQNNALRTSKKNMDNENKQDTNNTSSSTFYVSLKDDEDKELEDQDAGWDSSGNKVNSSINSNSNNEVVILRSKKNKNRDENKYEPEEEYEDYTKENKNKREGLFFSNEKKSVIVENTTKYIENEESLIKKIKNPQTKENILSNKKELEFNEKKYNKSKNSHVNKQGILGPLLKSLFVFTLIL